MKNATKHADTLHALLKRLRKECKPQPKQPQDPLHALVRGAMSYDVSDGRAEEAMKAINREFVDLNELRVATDLEIQELLGTRYPDIERRVAMITQSLNNIFEREHTLDLTRLTTISRRDSRAFLRELPAVHPFVEAYVMLYAFDGHCFPVDDETLKYLQQEDAVEEGISIEDAQKFVEHNIKAEDSHDLLVCCRSAVFDDAGRKKKKP